jgi:hypothetical protein
VRLAVDALSESGTGLLVKGRRLTANSANGETAAAGWSRAEDAAVVLGDEGLAIGAEPLRERAGLGHVTRSGRRFHRRE